MNPETDSITTTAQLDVLPDKTVIADVPGDLLQKQRDEWFAPGQANGFTSEELVTGFFSAPCNVYWRPAT